MVAPVLEAPPSVRRRTNGRIPPPAPPTGGVDGHDDEPSPRRPVMDSALLATLFLIGGEIMFFAGLVSAFWVLRVSASAWPPPLQPRLPVGVTGANTVVLLGSSVVILMAGRALERGERSTAERRLWTAAGLGATFLVVQGYEWLRLVSYGLTVGSSTYGSTFYTLVGAHAAHVVGALVWLTVSAVLLGRGRFVAGRTGALRACALYWHFVVALWPVLYVTVYLL